MSALTHQLRASGIVPASDLESATRRQQIYGGSLDTVLLELNLVDASTLNQELAQALKLPSAESHWLEAQEIRPWAAIPSAITDLGWAMPLGVENDETVVAVHPDIPDAQFDELKASPHRLRLVVTAECALARVASERTGALTPQRYAVLAARFVQALGGSVDLPESRPGGAPWRSASPSRGGGTLVADTRGQSEATPPSTGPILPPPSHASGVMPSWGAAPISRPAAPESQPAAPESQPATPVSQPVAPISVPRRAPDAAAPRFAPPTSSALFGGVLETPSAQPAEEIDLGPTIGALDAAQERDTVTEALLEGLELLFDRAALFAVRKSKLKLLTHSSTFRNADKGDLHRGAGLDAVFNEERLLRSLDDPDLRRALGQAGPIACVGAPVTVAGRAVLLAYGDLNGRSVDDAHAQRSAQLCKRAGEALTRVVTQRKGKAKKEASAGANRPVSSVPSIPPLTAPPSAAAAPAEAPAPELPRLIDRPPARNNTLISTKANQADPLPVAPLTPLGPTGGGPEAGAPTPIARILTPVPAQPPVRNSGGPAALLGGPSPSSRPAAPPVRTAATVPPVRNAGRAAPPFRNMDSAAPPIRDAGGTVPPIRRDLNVEAGAPPVRRGTPEAPQAHPAGRTATQESTMRPRKGVAPPPSHLPDAHAGAAAAPPRGRGPALRSPTLRAQAVSPRVSPGASGPPAQMVPLGPPLTQATTRGALKFDDEDRHDDSHERSGNAHKVQQREQVDAVIDDAIRNPEAIPKLLELGEPALARVAARFPGPLDLIRRDLNALPPLPAHGPLIRLTLSIGARMCSRIRELLDHPDAQIRFYASFAFQELRDEEVLDQLATRAFDPDGDVRTIAMRVLETYSRVPNFSKRVSSVRAELRSTNQTRQAHAARAVGTLRDVAAVPDLINLLDDPERRVRDLGLEALCSITGQQLGTRTGRWRNWWGANADRARVEWVIDALSHKEAAVRRWASSELRRITGQPYALPADGAKSEREVVVRQWKDWWETRGQAEFG